MKPIDFPQSNRVFAKNQQEYKELPAFYEKGIVTSCWQLSWKERFKLLLTGKLWLSIMTFGKPLQPQRPSVHSPFGK